MEERKRLEDNKEVYGDTEIYFGFTGLKFSTRHATKDFLVLLAVEKNSDRILLSSCLRRNGSEGKKAFKCQICFAFNMPIIVKTFQMWEKNDAQKGSDVDGCSEINKFLVSTRPILEDVKWRRTSSRTILTDDG